MKNIHLLPTDKPSRLHYSKVKYSEGISYKLNLNQEPSKCNDGLLSGQRHIYITSDEQPKHNDYYTTDGKEIYYCNTLNPTRNNHYKKVILTTDSDLIADGVQTIDDEFLEWFVKNPSCEEVEVEKRYSDFTVDPFVGYKIIIPQEEPKQETLEEILPKNSNGKYSRNEIEKAFELGAKWQAERMYSEKEVLKLVDGAFRMYASSHRHDAKEWLVEQFKKK